MLAKGTRCDCENIWEARTSTNDNKVVVGIQLFRHFEEVSFMEVLLS